MLEIHRLYLDPTDTDALSTLCREAERRGGLESVLPILANNLEVLRPLVESAPREILLQIAQIRYPNHKSQKAMVARLFLELYAPEDFRPMCFWFKRIEKRIQHFFEPCARCKQTGIWKSWGRTANGRPRCSESKCFRCNGTGRVGITDYNAISNAAHRGTEVECKSLPASTTLAKYQGDNDRNWYHIKAR